MVRKSKSNNELDLYKILEKALSNVESTISTKTSNVNTVDIITFKNEFLKVDTRYHPYMDIVLKLFYAKTYGNENLEITEEDIRIIKSIKNYNEFLDSDNIINQDERGLDEESIEMIRNKNYSSYYKGFLMEGEKVRDIVKKMSEEWGGNYWLGESIKVLNKSEKNPFHNMVLALGRRSGKSFLAAVVACYEVYKLLTVITCMKCMTYYDNLKSGDLCPKCKSKLVNNPQAYYDISGNEALRIIISATKQEQAVDPLLDYIYHKFITRCPFFNGKYRRDEQRGRVYFRSEYDELQNRDLMAAGQPEFKGSVVIITAGGNTKGQHGKGSILTIFDEFALVNQEGVDTDKAVLEALIPASAQYRQTRGDGRIIMISMPVDKTGQFYKYYKRGRTIGDPGFNKTLVMQTPTWEYNTRYSKEFIIENFADDFEGDASSASFHRVFGAQFLDTGFDVFLPEIFIEKAIGYELVNKDHPLNRLNSHYMHVDCAGGGSANYAYLVGHWEFDAGHNDKIFIEDRFFHWKYSDLKEGFYEGMDGRFYSIDSLIDEIIRVAKLFNIRTLSYDNMQSVESQHKFRKNGINLKKLNFSLSVQSIIYSVVETLFLEGRVKISASDKKLIDELKNLRRKPGGLNDKYMTLVMNEDSGLKSKDMADCLGGAIYNSYNQPLGRTSGLPSRLVSANMSMGSQAGNAAGGMNNRSGSIFSNINPSIFNG